MWYVSCNEWKNENFPLYDIKFASSRDGLKWSQEGKVSIKLKKEKGQSRDLCFYSK